MQIPVMIARLAAAARVERAQHMRYAGAFFGAGHAHPGLHHLDWLDQGRTTARVAGQIIPLQPGQALFVRAGRRHSSLEPAPAPVFDVYSVSFRLAGCPPWPPVIPVADREAAGTIFRELIDEFAAERPGRALSLRLLLARLFLQLWRGGTTPADPAGSAPAPADHAREKIRQAVDSIHAHYMRKISARDIAAAIHVSVSFLSHNFRRETGLAPNAYLVRYRLEKALWLLGKTGYKTAAIAAMIGFASPHYFYRVFKRHYKMPPRQYHGHAG